MARLATNRAPGRPRRTASDARFHRRLGEVLDHATEVFCEKGYEGASMRDLSRASGMSLAGLYHYFGSKERLLYLIQKHTFTTILEKLKRRLDGGAEEPAKRVGDIFLGGVINGPERSPRIAAGSTAKRFKRSRLQARRHVKSKTKAALSRH